MRKMKTKVLFSAAMMATLFAACTNEDFVDNSQKFDTANEGRITVENVALKFMKGPDADTRLTFDPNDRGWTWEGNEEIGALLMDNVWGASMGYRPYSNPDEWAKLTWLQKYQLTNEIHTDYKFTYDEKTESWTAPEAKVLEGNYFFAYPYEGYQGRRQLIHYMNNQVQEGSTEEAMAESFADNQFWIGYSQVMENQTEGDPVAGVYMTHVLAPIRLAITNTGTQTYHIEKIQVKGSELSSAITIDPTNANYDGESADKKGDYNLKNGVSHAWVSEDDKYFNYANFMGLEEDLYEPVEGVAEQDDKVWNIDDADNYRKDNALRKMVQKLEVGETQFSELVINNAEALLPGAQNTVYATIMVTPLGSMEGKDLTLTIYTAEGVVRDIDLRKVNEELGGNRQNTAVTDKAINELWPSTSNFINVQIDDQSFNQTDNLIINNEDDLLKFITWNQRQNRTYTATLVNDVTLTNEMQEMLVAAQGSASTAENLLVVTTENNSELTIAPGVADIFNYINVADVNVVAQGMKNINSDNVEALPDKNHSITLAANNVAGENGGRLYIQKYDLNEVLNVVNNNLFVKEATGVATNIKLTNEKGATAEISGDITFADDSENKAEATITVTAGGVLRAAGNLTNKGTIRNLGGEMYNLVNDNVESAIVYTSAEGVNHFNSNGANATIQRSTLEEDELSGTYSGGHIKYETTGTEDATAVVDAEVTDLVLNGATLRVNARINSGTLKSIEGTNATIEGGVYDQTNTWVAGTWTLLAMAEGGEIALSGETQLNSIRIPATGGIDILSGTVTVSGKVYFTADTYTTGYVVSMGSTEGFSKFGATIRVNKGARFVSGDVNEVAGTDNRIVNNGECYIGNPDNWNGNKVSGDEVQNINGVKD